MCTPIGESSGEFTLWNGQMFNFTTVVQAHQSAVRDMIWSHNEVRIPQLHNCPYVNCLNIPYCQGTFGCKFADV